ncbi:MAG: SDR family NAD(P)-dependent oxidoreductase [Actinobacteria bacterium]|nr:SDR family NAD(P)-dependent oxidoreductase [Actinomycetota bacterium]
MQDLEGKVAVVTGAASGIGLALARRFGTHGMKVTLADPEPDALERAAEQLRESGVAAAQFVCDVSVEDHLIDPATETYEQFGTAQVVCNTRWRRWRGWAALGGAAVGVGLDLRGRLLGRAAGDPSVRPAPDRPGRRPRREHRVPRRAQGDGVHGAVRGHATLPRHRGEEAATGAQPSMSFAPTDL